MERKNRPPYLARLVVSIILATLVFMLVISFTMFVNVSLYKTASARIDKVDKYINETSELLEDPICGKGQLDNATDMLSDAVNKMGVLEEEFGKKDPRVIKQKKEFSILQYKHLELIKKLNNKCDTSYLPVFYFYSNKEMDSVISSKTKKISYMLSNLVQNHPDTAKLYSLDYNLDIKPIKRLKNKYNVTDPPVVVIKGEKVVPDNINDLEKFIDEE